MGTTETASTTPAQPGSDQPSPGAGGWATDLGWRMLLVVFAAVLAAGAAPAPVTTAFAAAAAAAVVERLVRYRRRGMLDAALVGFGAVVIVTGLVGLLLNYLPGGITPTSWTVALGVLGIGSLVAVGLLDGPVPPNPFRPLLTRRSLPTAAWSLAAVAVLVLALTMSAGSFDRTHIAPVDLAGTAVQDGFATVTVSAGSSQGPFELDLVTAAGRVAVARDISVTADSPVAVVVAVPTGARLQVQLVAPGSTNPLRQLTFDTTDGNGR